jgi:hypothetical protein
LFDGMARSDFSFCRSYTNVEFLYQVQVPSQLVRGVCVGRDRPRSLLSRGLCQDLGDEVFLCLHCEERFSFLGDLLQHARRSVLASCCPAASVRTSGTRSSSASTARSDSHSLATSYSMRAGQSPAHSHRSVSFSFMYSLSKLIHVGLSPSQSCRPGSCS